MEFIVLLLVLGVIVLIAYTHSQTRTSIDAIKAQLVETRTLQGQTTEVFGQIQSSIGRLTEVSRHMEEVGSEIASLNDILRAPKVRGAVGELLLGDLLAQMLSREHYHLQYSFKGGDRVDAVIVLQAGMVPVDAKFPLDSFQRIVSANGDEDKTKQRREFVRAVKRHIDTIAQKYIRPDEKTFDFALMYIPAENVYYETIIKDENLGDEGSLLSYALQKHVIPVSPNSFYAYLQAITLGLKGMQVEKKAEEILRLLQRIETDFSRCREEYATLGTHLDHALKKYQETDKLFGTLSERLASAHGPGASLPGATHDALTGPSRQ